jgi:hypothetical protein
MPFFAWAYVNDRADGTRKVDICEHGSSCCRGESHVRSWLRWGGQLFKTRLSRSDEIKGESEVKPNTTDIRSVCHGLRLRCAYLCASTLIGEPAQ